MSTYETYTQGTDGGFADRFVDQHGHELKYIHELGRWVAYDGKCWTRADEVERARQTAATLYDEIKGAADTDRQAVFQWAKRSHNTNAIKSMLYQAKERLGVSIGEFDNNPEVINCLNGVVDLKTKTLLPHSPDLLVLRQADANYDPEAGCPRWLSFLDEVFEEDRELVEWLQVAAGYSITGLVDEHCFFILYGSGRNGKGVLGETLLSILGSYASTTDVEAFLSNDKTNVRAMAAVGDLRGLRFALGSEINANRRLDEAFIKRLTGGDTRRGTKLHADAFHYQPTDKLWFQTNHLPAIKDATLGMWERVRVIPFNKTFEGSSKDTTLRRQLQAERDGIFAWLVEGASKYLSKYKLPPVPKAVELAIQEYRDKNDTLSKFIGECLERSAGETIPNAETHTRYERWCLENQIDEIISHRFFRDRMEERGIKSKITRSGGRVFVGYRFKEAPAASTKPTLEDWYASQPKTDGWETYKTRFEIDKEKELESQFDW